MSNLEDCCCSCHEPNSKNAPPDLFNRLQMFMDLSQEYLEVMPDISSKKLLIRTNTMPGRKLRRTLILFYSQARKFFNKSEQVSLRKINIEILREYGDMLPQTAVDAIKEDQHFYSQLERALFDVQTLVIQGADGQVQSNVQQVYNVMYGRVLHADFPKWSRGHWATAFSQLQDAMFHVRDLIWSMRSNIVYMFDEGLLPGLQFERVIMEDLFTPLGEYESTSEREHYKLDL